jgi:NodT family efflux transporter outer membrane factor (OMF) lipoprotein
MRRTLSLLLSALLLSACVSAPSTEPLVPALKSDTLGLGAALETTIDAQWWKAFRDPQLDALIERTLAGNPGLKAALARVRIAQAGLSVARAQSRPQVTFDAHEQRERFSKNSIIPPPFAGANEWVGTIQGNFSWTLDFFGKEAARIAEARDTTEAAALDATAARLALAGSVTQADIALERAYVLCDVAEETVRQRQDVYDLTVGRVHAGLDTPASQKQAEALLHIAKEERIEAEGERDLGAHAIAALAGRGADAYKLARPHLDATALELPGTLPADLLARRADIAAAEARVAAAIEARTLAHKEFYPDVDLVAFAGTAALGLGPLFSLASRQYGIGPAIHLPVFDAGKIRADYAGATASLDETVADYNDTLLAAVKETADAITNVERLEREAGEQHQALAASQASFDLARERYRSGLSPQLNVLQAEDTVITARQNDATLADDTASARVALVMALGGGFENHPENSHE